MSGPTNLTAVVVDCGSSYTNSVCCCFQCFRVQKYLDVATKLYKLLQILKRSNYLCEENRRMLEDPNTDTHIKAIQSAVDAHLKKPIESRTLSE